VKSSTKKAVFPSHRGHSEESRGHFDISSGRHDQQAPAGKLAFPRQIAMYLSRQMTESRLIPSVSLRRTRSRHGAARLRLVKDRHGSGRKRPPGRPLPREAVDALKLDCELNRSWQSAIAIVYAVIEVKADQDLSHLQKAAGVCGAIKGLFHRQYEQTVAVNDVSFKIEPGELVGFLGPNGAGKTTTLKMLAGLLYPTGGSACVLGYVPVERATVIDRQFALVLGQKNQLWWDLPPRIARTERKNYGIPPTVSSAPSPK